MGCPPRTFIVIVTVKISNIRYTIMFVLLSFVK